MNALKGTITEICSSDMISFINVDVDGDIFSSIVLEGKNGRVTYKKGDDVNIVFKETEVGIAKGLSGQISFRNRFAGRVRKVERGVILTKVILEYKSQAIESIISSKSADAMKLREQEMVEWLVKTNEVSLMTVTR